MIDIPWFIQTLLQWQGVPWHHQGRGHEGVDCVGLALCALAEQDVHIDVPANYAPSAAAALLLAAVGRVDLLQRLDLAEPAAGDVLVFRIRREPQHLAIALGGGRMIHAVRGAGVVAVTISALWRDRLVARYGWRHG